MTLNDIIAEFESNLKHIDLLNIEISKSSIGWQIEHSLKVFNAVCKTLIKSNPEDYYWKLNFKRMIFLNLNYFPRFKAKAPKFVNPKEASLENIEQEFKNAKSLLKQINTLPAKSNFEHFVFGRLNLKQSKKFLKTHSFHHLKIIREIKASL